MKPTLHSISLMVVCLIIAFAGSMLAATAHATPITDAVVAVRSFIGTPLFMDEQSGATAVQVRGGASDGFGSMGEASAFADFGVIKIKGSAIGSITAASAGTFADTFTITSPGVPNGTQGALNFSIAVGGILDSSGGSSTWRLQASVPAGALLHPIIDKGGTQFLTGYIGDSFGVYFGTLSFLFGQPAFLAVSLRAGTASGDAGYDFSHSLFWNGVSNVTANGVPVDTFDAASESGTDYRFSFVPAAVPEPTSALLFVSGLLLVALQHVTRRHRSGH